MERSTQLEQLKISQLLWKFSLPAIFGMVVNALYNVVDRIFVGQRVGSLGIAGITIGFPILGIIFAFAMLIGFGTSTLISVKLGEKNRERAEHTAGNAVIVVFILAVVQMVVGLIWLEPLLLWFGASPAILPYAMDYMRIILCGTIFLSVSFVLNQAIRAEGSPKMAMITMLVGAVANIILDFLFVIVFDWGIKGAAWATIISQFLSMCWVIYYFASGSSELKLALQHLKLKLDVVLSILKVGFPMFGMQLAGSLLGFAINRSLLTHGGDVAISAMGVINSIAMFIMMPIFGINQGLQPIVGYNYGARKGNRVREALRLAVWAATVVVVFWFIILQFFSESMMRLFNRDDLELILLGARAMRIYFMLLPIIGFQIVCSGYFQAVGKAKEATFLSLSRQLIFFLPLLLILPRFFGLDGVIFTGPACDALSTIVTAFLFFREMRHLKEDTESNTVTCEELKTVQVEPEV